MSRIRCRIRRLLVLAAALSVAPVRTSDAQTLDFGVACTTFAFAACASVELWTGTNASTGQTELVIKMANVQGTQGFTHLSAAGLIGFSIANLLVSPLIPQNLLDPNQSGPAPTGISIGNVRDGCQTLTGTCNPGPFTGNVFGDWFAGYQANGLVTFTNSIASGNSGGLLWGCDVPVIPDNPTFSGYSTCKGSAIWRVSLALNAGIQLTQNTSVTLSFRDAQSANAVCTTGVDCAIVTPEPATMLLLGSGLFSVGAAHLRRRRKRNEAA